MYIKEREREIERARARYDCATRRHDDGDDDDDDEEEDKEEKDYSTHGETKALSAKRRRTSACRRRRTRPRRLPKTWKAFYNRVVVYYILRFFCDDVTTRFVFDFHKIFSHAWKLFSLSRLSDSLVCRERVRWWWRRWRWRCFLRMMIKNNVLNVLLSEG